MKKLKVNYLIVAQYHWVILMVQMLKLVVGVIALYGGTVFLMKVNEKKQVTATQQSAETEITILNKIIDNDSENIEEDMQKLNYPKKKQVDIYVKLGDYTKVLKLWMNV